MCGHCGADNLWKINVYFLSQILIEKKIYCEYKGNISNFLNNSLHESLALEFVIILITLFWILKIFSLCGWNGNNNNSLELYLRPSNINTIYQQVPCFLAQAGTIVTHWLKSHSQEMPYFTTMNIYTAIGCVLYSAVHWTRVQSRGELSYLAPLGSEKISAPYFKQCFFRGGGLPPRLSQTPRLPVPRQK